MQYAIELYYDEKTEHRLYALAKRVSEEKISEKFLAWGTRPHLTLACFNDVDEALCQEKLTDFARTHKVMPARLDAVGMFNDTKTVFLSPTMTATMYRFQRELHACLTGFDTKGFEWYCPDQWVPHCTMALTKEDGEDAFLRASELILREFQKLTGEFAAIGLVKVTFPVKECLTLPLAR